MRGTAAGNDVLAAMTARRQYTLRVDVSLVNASGFVSQGTFQYSNFVVGGAATKYQLLSVGTFSGTPGKLSVLSAFQYNCSGGLQKLNGLLTILS